MPQDEAEGAIEQGRVTLGGRQVRQPLAMVRAGDVVTVDGHRVSLETPTLALMFHKPAGSITAVSDKEGHPTVFDLLRARLPRKLERYQWHAVGRLDRGTTGLLLFTNDEQLVEHATSPASKLGKRYLAHVGGTVTPQKLEQLRRGVALEDGQTLPAQAALRSPQEIELTLFEGRNHQAKRMLGALGLPVLTLHREAIGALVLDVPTPSDYRPLEAEEIRDLLGFERATG